MEQRQTSRPEAAAEAEGPVSTSRTRKRSAIWLRLTSQSAANCAAAVIVRQTEAGRAQASAMAERAFVELFNRRRFENTWRTFER